MAEVRVRLDVDGSPVIADIDTRTTLLDLLRDQLRVYAAKKGCDHGQCGACTVLLDGIRILSCLRLAAATDGQRVVTAAGLADGGLHAIQQAFLRSDALQCGYCTPGQVCSAVGMLGEFRAGTPSYVSDLAALPARLDDAEIRERMSGNLCRCGAYPNILAAIREVADGDPV